MEKNKKNKKESIKNELLDEALTAARAAFKEDISKSEEELMKNPFSTIINEDTLLSDLFMDDFIIE